VAMAPTNAAAATKATNGFIELPPMNGGRPRRWSLEREMYT
jgi:hypothetical protein